MKTAYFDCFGGASGDMILGALVDAGAEVEAVKKELSKLGLSRIAGSPVELGVSVIDKAGIRATRVEVEGGDATVANTIADAIRIVESAGLDDTVGGNAIGVLRKLGDAEDRVHGTHGASHLHELGTADTLVDVVGVAAALTSMGVHRVVSSSVPVGSGAVRTAHGLMPVPAPAVVELFRMRNDVRIASDRWREVDAELTTPTGAAILVHYTESFGGIPSMSIEAAGWGAGTRDLPFPNVFRVIVGNQVDPAIEQAQDVLIEANIDDMNPELYEYVLEKVFGAGAVDAWIVPVIGKRGRPGSVLSVLAPRSAEVEIRDVILAETSTIGLRTRPVDRWVLEREWLTVKVEGYPVRVKIAKRGERVLNVAPEYADCVEAARQTGLPLKEVFRRASLEVGRVGVGETGVEPA